MAGSPLHRTTGGPVFAGQRAQEPSDQFDLPRGQEPTELASRHLLDRQLQGLGPSIVEIGSRDGHVAQARNTEDEPVVRLAGDGETAEVGGADGPLRERVVKDTEPLKQIAADIHALMAGAAAIVLEEPVAALFLGRDGIPLPAQVTVKACIGRDQRALEGRKGIQHVCRRGVAPVDRREGLPVSLIGV